MVSSDNTESNQEENPAPIAQQDGYLLYSKKRKVLLKAEQVEVDGIQQQLEEGTNPQHYAQKHARETYEGALRESLLAENLIVLTGAGSSIGIGESSGLSMGQLWAYVASKKPSVLSRFAQLVHYDVSEKNLETLLTHAEQYLNYHKRLYADASSESRNLRFVRATNDFVKRIIIEKCDFADSPANGTSFKDHTHNYWFWLVVRFSHRILLIRFNNEHYCSLRFILRWNGKVREVLFCG